MTVTNFNSATNTLTIDIDTVDQTIGGIPISTINGTYTLISGTDIDSYTVIPDLSSTDLKSGYVALETHKVVVQMQPHKEIIILIQYTQ